MECEEYVAIIITMILVITAGIMLMNRVNLMLDSKPYTIQDVYVYCCENPEIEITIRGDNCTNVINNIY